MTPPSTQAFAAKVERSSFGTPSARRLRQQTSDKRARQILEQATKAPIQRKSDASRD